MYLIIFSDFCKTSSYIEKQKNKLVNKNFPNSTGMDSITPPDQPHRAISRGSSAHSSSASSSASNPYLTL